MLDTSYRGPSDLRAEVRGQLKTGDGRGASLRQWIISTFRWPADTWSHSALLHCPSLIRQQDAIYSCSALKKSLRQVIYLQPFYKKLLILIVLVSPNRLNCWSTILEQISSSIITPALLLILLQSEQGNILLSIVAFFSEKSQLTPYKQDM